jgi:tetratricopeptide (TPR) repeat protein
MTQTFDPDAALDAALQLHSSGHLAEAEQIYRHVIDGDPENIDALNLLGVLLQDTNRLDGAIDLLTSAVTLDPEFAEAHANLARAQCARQDWIAARHHSERAIALDPAFAEAYLQDARALLMLMEPEAAAAAAAKAVALKPDMADAHLYLGHAQSRRGDFRAAAEAYRTADTLRPNVFSTVHGLCLALVELGDLQEALKLALDAVGLEPGHVEAHAALSLIRFKLQDIEGACDALTRAVAIAPDRADLWQHLGNAQSLCGRFDDAAASYLAVLKLDPAAPMAIGHLNAIGRLPKSIEPRDALRAALADTGRPIAERVDAGFSLGAALDSRGDYADAFAAYSTANRLAKDIAAKRGISFNRAGFLVRIEQTRALFHPGAFAATKGWGNPSEQPVFIVGMPRSGTSLVEQILASHSDVFGAGERLEFFSAVQHLYADAAQRDPMTWDRHRIRSDADSHLNWLTRIGGGARRVINKLPDNVLVLGQVAILFPNARIILCRRDHRDVSLSCFFQNFPAEVDWATDIADCAVRTRAIERLMDHWVENLPSRILQVDYGRLVSDPEAQSRRLIDFLGLPWEEACLSFQNTERVVSTASFWQVRQPIYASSVDRWRHYEPYAGRAWEVFDSQQVNHEEWLAQARAALSLGQPESAMAAYRQSLALAPDQVEALREMGHLARDQGATTEAAAAFARAAVLAPDDFAIQMALAAASGASGAFEAMATAAGAATKLRPADADALVMLGTAELNRGNRQAAKEALDEAARQASPSRDTLVGLANAYVRLEDLDTATHVLEQAVIAHPHDVECLTKLGRLLGERHRTEEATAWLRTALTEAPGNGHIHLALAEVRWIAKDIDGSQAACLSGLAVSPEMAALWVRLAQCHATFGRFEEAIDAYRRALAIDPDLPVAQLGLAEIDKTTGPAARAHLDTLLANDGADEMGKISALFLSARQLEKTNDYDGAWATYALANARTHALHVAKGRAFDAAAFSSEIERLITNFTTEFFRYGGETGVSTDVPVFIVGMPRSGTTLIEQIASSHRAVSGAGEVEAMIGIAERLDRQAGDGSLLDVPQGVIEQEAQAYLAHLRSMGGDAARITDKMPANLTCLGHVAMLFPRARVIICHRDPRDVALSCYQQDFGHNLPVATELNALAVQLQGYARLAAHWRSALPLPILDVQYEDFITDLEGQSRRLIDFLGLPWDPACLRFQDTERPILTASMWQVRQPLYATSVGRWRRYSAHLGTLLAGIAGLAELEGGEDWAGLANDRSRALACGLFQQRAGQLDSAQAIYQALLKRNASDIDVVYLLSGLLLDANNVAEALALITPAVLQQPLEPRLQAIFARANLADGNAGSALNAAEKALALAPDMVEALLYAGCASQALQNLGRAAEAFRRATELAPHVPETWTNLITALTMSGDHAGCRAAWSELVALKPDDPALLVEYGKSLAGQNQFADALAVFSKADALAPGLRDCRYGIAAMLLHLGDIQRSVEICRDSLRGSDDAAFYLLLANGEATLGHFEASSAACRKALAIDPTLAGAIKDLVALGGGEDARQAAEAIWNDAAAVPRDRADAGFALGRILDREGAFDQAFETYRQANKLLRDDRHGRGFVFDRGNFSHLIDRQIEAHSPDTFAATAGWGIQSDVPIFVVGMPRSGTSLVEQILASHPEVFGAGERTEIFTALQRLEGAQPGCSPTLWDRSATFKEAQEYLDLLSRLSGGARHVVDKQPDNVLCLGQIAVMFPQARVIICRRDPRDIALSCYFQRFRDDPLVWTDDLADCGFRLREVDRLIDHWRSVLPLPILEVSYESLVGNLEAECRRMIAFAGLPWDPDCLSFHKTERVVATASHWQVRQPLYDASAGRWRHYEAHLGALLTELGANRPHHRAG